MTALAADTRRVKYAVENATELYLSMAANAVIYAGGLVNINASGYATAGADTANHKCVGIAIEGVSNSGGADGAKSVRVLTNVIGEFAVQAGSITIADTGLLALVQDDNTVCDATTGANDIPIGMVVGMNGSSALVYVGVGVGRTNAP